MNRDNPRFNDARYISNLLDRLDELAADEKEGTPEYADLRDEMLAFVDTHPAVASIVRESGYPV